MQGFYNLSQRGTVLVNTADGGTIDTGMNESTAKVLGNGGIKVNSTLQHEEYIRYTEALERISRPRLVAIDAMRNANLDFNAGGLGVMVSKWQKMSGVTPPTISMKISTPAEKDRPEFDQGAVPIPIFHKEFDLDLRTLEASRTTGEALDTSTIEEDGESIAVALDSMVFNGVPDLKFANSTMPGILNQANVNTYTIPNSWNTVAGRDPVNDVLEMQLLLNADNMYGPFTLFVNTSYWLKIQDDYSVNKGDRTFLERILAFNDIVNILPAAALPADTVALVQMQSKVLDLPVGQDIVAVELANARAPMASTFMVYAAMAVRVKATFDGDSGVCIGSV